MILIVPRRRNSRIPTNDRTGKYLEENCNSKTEFFKHTSQRRPDEYLEHGILLHPLVRFLNRVLFQARVFVHFERRSTDSVSDIKAAGDEKGLEE